MIVFSKDRQESKKTDRFTSLVGGDFESRMSLISATALTRIGHRKHVMSMSAIYEDGPILNQELVIDR
jgi:hypothetical protein